MTFVVPTLSHANVERLLERYLKNNPPAVNMPMDPGRNVTYANPLVHAGILRVNGHSWPDCEGVFPAYDVTPRGYEIIDAMRWHVDRREYPNYVEVPLGSFSLIHGSMKLQVKDPKSTIVFFNYFFHGNGNIAYLLSLAPAKAWGDAGVDGGGYVVPISKAGQIVRDKLMLSNDGDGWYVNADPFPMPPPPHCDFGVPQGAQTPAPQPSQTPL